MIQSKQKKQFVCSSCHATFPRWRGQCTCGVWNTINEEAVDAKVYRIPKISDKRKAEKSEQKGQKSDLDIFFDFQIEHELKHGICICENCKKDVRYQLKSEQVWIKRGTIAHIVSKKKFVSIAVNLNNFLILCLGCHSEYDSSWAKAIKMPVFRIAKTRFKLFQNLIQESTGKLPKEFFEK